jgi:putative intracellular protease/amidase
MLDPDRPKRIVLVASNPAVSEQTGSPIGFWWAELSHPFLEFSDHGYDVDVASPDGGALRGDSWSDPRDDSGYSAEDLVSLGFLHSPAHDERVHTLVDSVYEAGKVTASSSRGPTSSSTVGSSRTPCATAT